MRLHFAGAKDDALTDNAIHVGRAPITCLHGVKVCFYFSLLFEKRGKVTDAVTHLLVLLFALMENVKGAQPC